MDLIKKQTQLQLSISQHIANAFNLASRRPVMLRKMDPEMIVASHIEISFREQYIGRSDMWILKKSLMGNTVYNGQKISSLGVRGSVKDIYVNGKVQQCGYINEQTKTIFRSETAKYYVFIQMSKEMWEFDEDGEMFFGKCVHGFLPELFKKWKELGTNHVVSIIMFARILYNEQTTEGLEFHKDAYGRLCRDYYRVVVDWETAQDWSQMLIPLKKEFIKFQRDVLQRQDDNGSSFLSGTNSTASEGNVLEAVNLALNPLDKHYIDRDLSRTGLSIVIITPGTGIFEVDRDLCRLTTQRMTDNGIGLDLVCLSKPPLHAAPLFQFVSKEELDKVFEDKKSERFDKSLSGPKSHLDKFLQSFDSSQYAGPEAQALQFMVPKWVEPSYWGKQEPNKFVPRCKMYEVQMMGLFDHQETKMDVPYLNLSKGAMELQQFFEQYDDNVFKFERKTHERKHREEPKLQEIEEQLDDMIPHSYKSSRGYLSRSPGTSYLFEHNSGMKPIRIDDKSPTRGSYSGSERESPNNDSRRGSWQKMAVPTKIMMNTGLVNPWNPEKEMRGESNMYRWDHVFPVHQGSYLMSIYTHWKSLCTPASLPLTTEFFPTQEELMNFYQEYTYTVYPSDESFFQKNQESKRIAHFLEELARQRLNQGFQLIVPPQATAKGPVVPEYQDKDLFYVSLGDHVHRLALDPAGSNIEVKRYIRKIHYDTNPIHYRCHIWPKHQVGYQKSIVEFQYPHLMNYNWNYLDHLISGYQEDLTESLRFWRTRFLLIPLEGTPVTDSSDLDEEEERIAAFKRFLEQFEKTKFLNQEKPTKVIRSIEILYTTLHLSTFVRNEVLRAPTRQVQSVTSLSDKLSKQTSVANITTQMQQSNGVSIADRRWHFKLYEQVFIGEECVDWLIKRFSDIDTREQAVEFGNHLLSNGVFEHANSKHKFLDGFYFYRLRKDLVIEKPKDKSQGTWFYSRKQSKFDIQDDLELASSPKDIKKPVQARTFGATKEIRIDMDPSKKSSRREIAILHYDSTHNPNHCYHFQIHWLVCTARLIEDMLNQWTRVAEKCGLKLVEAPVDQPTANDSDPFRSIISIPLALGPPPIDQALVDEVHPQYYEMELLKHFNFILDVEADEFFPPNGTEYTYTRRPYQFTQFVHRTGVAFIQILPQGKGFLWAKNRILVNADLRNTASITAHQTLPQSIRESFRAFCQDEQKLNDFWSKKQQAMQSLLLL
ncbi:hypothetical protein EDD86DRAFT_201680 [Gorgonomyces haynaldii]|nr:hypothetical protein EDD86DRAFT_201680 [Gorgonomyces haynaldii]